MSAPFFARAAKVAWFIAALALGAFAWTVAVVLWSLR